MIDRRLKRSAAYLFILAAFSLFGIIHSASPDGVMYLPWALTGIQRQIPYQFSLAYALFGVLFLILSFTNESGENVAIA